MRLATARTQDGDRCVLRRRADSVDVQRALALRGVDVGAGVRDFLELPQWRTLALEILDAELPEHVLYRGDLDLGPVVPNPSKIIFVGGNTHSHLAEAESLTGGGAPKRPMVAAKTTNAINGPFDTITQPAGTSTLDFEAELCVVIGSLARRVSERDVASVVAGYCVANDVSDREYQLATWEDNSFFRTHYLGKSFDGFCPCGPELVTADEVGELSNLRLSCSVNGKMRQDSTLADLYFSVEEVVSFLTIGMTLNPGDLILMGSAAGVAHFDGETPYGKPGDIVRCEVQGVGAIENRVVADW